MNPIRHISYDRGDSGYQIRVYAPTASFPMYQITCNDPDSGYGDGTICRYTEDQVNEVLACILSRAEAWEEATA